MKTLKRLPLLVFAIASFFITTPSMAIDANGYTALYECRAGNTNCNVDIDAYDARACDQNVAVATAWASIDWNTDTNADTYIKICINNGDHTGKDTLTIPSSANGTSSNRRMLSYYRASDNNDDPWNQSGANQAILRGIIVEGDYWIVHRLSFDGNLTGTTIWFPNGTNGSNNIFNRVLAEQSGSGASFRINSGDADNNTLQNSVLRNPKIAASTEVNGVDLTGAPDDTHIVNNEIYNHNQEFGIEDGSCSTNSTVIENNDLYRTPSMLTNCSGGVGTACQKAEGIISNKCGAQPGEANTTKYIHNRLWQTRKADTSVCCLGGANGHAVSLSTQNLNAADNILFQNNILMDSQSGIRSIRATNDNISIIGNLFYNIQNFYAPIDPGYDSTVLDIQSTANAVEVYLNTAVDAEKYWGSKGATNSDWRCNTFIDAGTTLDSLGFGTQFDRNVFYGTTLYTTGSNNINNALLLRANSTPYTTGQIVRTSATPVTGCVEGTEAACFLYKVIAPGTSAGTPPTPCTFLGCEYTDGGVTLKAVRGPYRFYRKLKTVSGGEPYVIPYFRVHTSAPEATPPFCPGSGSVDATGSRTNIGVNDEIVPTGIHATSLLGTGR